jgi:hypothetical protein
MNPPMEVLSVILAEEAKQGTNAGGEARRDTRMAYIDYLLSGRSVKET